MKGNPGLSILIAIGSVASVPAMAGMSAEIGGGLTFPSGDFGDAAERGWEGHAGIDFPLRSCFSLGPEAAYGRMNASDEYIASIGGEPGTFDDARFSLWRAGVRGQFQLASSGTWSPVVGAGVGAYGLNTKVTTLFAGERSFGDTNAGVSARGGVLIRPEFAGAFSLMAGYHTIFTERNATNYFDLTASWNFGGGE